MRTIKTVGELFPTQAPTFLSTGRRATLGMIFYSAKWNQHYVTTNVMVSGEPPYCLTMLLAIHSNGKLSLEGVSNPIKNATIQMVMDAYGVVPVADLEDPFLKVQ
jgi:hypothetical protein